MIQTSLAHPAIAKALKELSARHPRASAFAKELFSRAEPEDVEGMEPALLAELAEAAFDHLQDRQPQKAKVAVKAYSGASAIFISNDDMPFLVDSVMGLVSGVQTDVRLVLHPVVRVTRNKQGLAETTEATHAKPESFILILTGMLPTQIADSLKQQIEESLQAVRMAVNDWQPMQSRIQEIIKRLETNPPKTSKAEIEESIAFLRWLLANHFTLLGIREYRHADGKLIAAPQALGILKDESVELLLNPKDTETAFLSDSTCVFITKSDVLSQVHRRALMDYCGVKLYGPTGEPEGEIAIAGLFTSSAYTQSPQDIPLIREKIKAILQASGLAMDSHSGKALINVLETYPRDELLQTPRAELERIALGVLRLEERPRPRLFARRDRFDRLVSAFVYLPRDRFNTELSAQIGAILAEAYAAEVTSFQPAFNEGALVRVHFLLARKNRDNRQPDTIEIEKQIVQASRSWTDRLHDALLKQDISTEPYLAAFPAGYRAITSPEMAVADIKILNGLASPNQIAAQIQFHETRAKLKLRLHRLRQAIPLSDRLPILENMGFRAIEESTHILSRDGPPLAFLHEIILETSGLIEDDSQLEKLRACFLAVWNGEAEDDSYNALVLSSAMSWQEAAVLRALGKYLRQAGLQFSAAYIAQCLVKNSAIAKLMLGLFYARAAGKALPENILEQIDTELKTVSSLDEDRILRRFQNLIEAMQRTNYFASSPPKALAFKFASRQIEGLPEPRPFAEIFVYSPDVEGIHLRFGPIARGGLRWSDRPEDFRTEVLGLVKAQNVKNAVIVPVGAKGGFVPKKLGKMESREAIAAEGLRCYRIFIESLLSLTDNLVKGKPTPPPGVFCRDGDDPYLVVAADKGTASFSDEANAIAQAHGFWLDDAFASGGSAGYDHKKMGITARGAFVAVDRHFREFNIDIQKTEFTVAGVGDMSGDVFGNGMLLSPKICLVAAFDHRDIFIDPAPQTDHAYAERKRLFALPRSSWQDYDKTKLSPGGGIFSRSQKSILLSQQAQKLLGLNNPEVTPPEVIRAILKLNVDLLWFGGIGTYVKASHESHADAGDKANDGLRVNATDIRARVVGEGANLGFTQAARIEYARAGGHINNDAVDNSAGVNSSDYEVNIKIALGAAMQAGKLTRPQRDSLLASMTEDVAQLVLRNNRLQTLCLTLAHARSSEEISYEARLIHKLELRGELNRGIEFLPDERQIRDKEFKGEGLTRPELAVVMAYAKLSLHDQLLASNLPDDAYFSRELSSYFPVAVMNAFATEVNSHPLRRQIIATLLANSLINRLGPSYPERVMEESGASADDLARAYALARDCLSFRALQSEADGFELPHEARMEILLELQLLLRRATTWFLHNVSVEEPLESVARRYRDGLTSLRSHLPSLLPQASLDRLHGREKNFRELGLSPESASRFAALRLLQRGLDIVEAAQQAKRPLDEVARAFFASSSDLGVDQLLALTTQIKPAEFYERLAISGLVDQIFQSHRSIVANAVSRPGGWQAWRQEKQTQIRQFDESLSEMATEKTFSLARLSVAAHALSKIATQ